MPTVAYIGAYRLFFYSGDRSEPPHVHVERGNEIAKFWLSPVRLQSSERFRSQEIRRIQRLIEQHEQELLEAWHNTLVIERRAQAQTVNVTEEELIVALDNGRTISAPLAWFPRLLHGTPEERANWRLIIGDGEGIHWPDPDEDIEVRHLLAGIPSRETQHSLQRWL